MKLLIATDGSASATAALQAATRLVSRENLEVVVLTVARQPITYTDGYPYGVLPLGPDASQQLFDETRQVAEDQLEQARRVLTAAGLSARYVLRWGDAAEEVLRLAEDIRPDLIVLGSHGRGALGRLVQGSVSDAVLRRWAGATMVVKTPEVAGPVVEIEGPEARERSGR